MRMEPIHAVQVKIIKKGGEKHGNGKHSDNQRRQGKVCKGA